MRTTARSLAAVPLTHQKSLYGWLIAVDRLSDAYPAVQAPCDLQSPEFGSREVSLLSTAACLLAGHIRNTDLFRAEQALRLGVIESIVEAIDARDPYTCGHSRRVGMLAARIGKHLKFTTEEQEQLYVSGLLHDVGKIGVPDGILRKDGKLTDEEFSVIKQHPRMGWHILTPLHSLSHVLPGVLHHHERVDGRGYPDGLAGENIPINARILAVADSYDAMTSNRAYRAGLPRQRAIDILNDCAGTQWDEEIVRAFIASMAAEWN
jgi:HD-GYP domain-containing protein (c-di-GMP phosphodiesterase class II)